MKLYYYSLLAIFGVVLYMMSVDKNVGDYIILSLKIFRLNLERWRWMFIYHPNNFVTTWWRMRKYRQFVKEIQAGSQTDHSEAD